MKVSIGDTITALGHTYTVGKIIYQDCFDGNYDVEFLDPSGGYHHWKSKFDGGHIISNNREEQKMKVSVAVALYYNYETEIPDDTAREELLWVCDNEDPVYREIAGVLHEAKLNYDAVTTSIIREDTDEIIYSM